MGVEVSKPVIPAGLVDPEIVYDVYKNDWYKQGLKYWEKIDPTVDGMLGGFPEISPSDSKFNSELIEKYQKDKQMPRLRAADVGAGIGRVTKEVLSKYFDHVDIVEPVKRFVDVAKKELQGVCEFDTFVCGAQNWKIQDQYDCIWNQWVLMFLKDQDAVDYLKRCKDHLTKKGYIIVKDNVASGNKLAMKDEANWYPDDRSVARTYMHYRELFDMAGLRLVEEIETQEETKTSEGEDLMPIFTFVLH